MRHPVDIIEADIIRDGESNSNLRMRPQFGNFSNPIASNVWLKMYDIIIRNVSDEFTV